MPRPSRVPVRVAEPVAESTLASQRPTTPGHARAEWDTLLANVRAGMLPEMPQALRSVRQPEEILRGGATAVQLTPTGIVVKAVRPQLRWPVRTGARSTVIVFRGEVEVLRSGPLTSARWTPSSDLERGVSYAWQVNIETDDDLEILPSPPAPPARFHVLDARTLAELQAAERFHPNDHLLLGILCARAGLDSEARGHLQRVTLPGDVGAARRLVREIESWRLQ